MARTIDEIRRLTNRTNNNGRGTREERAISPSSNGRSMEDIRRLLGRETSEVGSAEEPVNGFYGRVSNRAQDVYNIPETKAENPFRYGSLAEYDNALANMASPSKGKDVANTLAGLGAAVINLMGNQKGISHSVENFKLPTITPNALLSKKNQYTTEEREYNNLLAERERYSSEHAWDEYKKLMDNEDFAQNIISGPTPYSATNKQYGGSQVGMDDFHRLTKEQEDVAKYIYNTQGKEAYDKYVNDIYIYNDKMLYNAQEKALIDWSNEGNSALRDTALTAATVPGKLMGNLGATAQAIDAFAKGRSYNPYGIGASAGNLSDEVREEVSKDIEEATPNAPKVFGQNIGSFAYNTGLSMVDSTVGALTFGEAYVPLMGASAFSSSYKELKENGATDEQATAGALASGIAEAFFEKFSIENLVKAKDVVNPQTFVKELLKQAGIEASEETFTEVTNILSNSIIMGTQSDIQKRVYDLQKEGYSDEEIQQIIERETFNQIASATLGGFLSGGGMGTAFNAVNYYNMSGYGSTIDREKLGELNFSDTSAEKSEALNKKYGEEWAQKAKNAEIGSLYNTHLQETTEKLDNANVHMASEAIAKTYDISRADADQYAKALLTGENSKVLNSHFGEVIKEDFDNETGWFENIESDPSLAEEYSRTISARKSQEQMSAEKASKALKIGHANQVKGEDVKIISMTENKDGSYTIETDRGNYKSKDVTVDQNTANALSWSANIADKALKEAYVANYEGEDISDYDMYARYLYEYGKLGIDWTDRAEQVLDTMSREKAESIYNAGMEMARKEDLASQESLNKLIEQMNPKKSTFRTGKLVNGRFVEDKNVFRNLTNTQKRIYRVVEGFGKIAGINIDVINDPSDDSINGEFVNEGPGGTIIINMAARPFADSKYGMERYVISTLSHELTHWMKANDLDAYKVLENAIKETLTEKGTLDKFIKAEKDNALKQTGEKLDDETALEEVVARACEDMLNDSSTMEEILSHVDETGLGKLKKAFENWFAHIREFLDELMAGFKAPNDMARSLEDSYESLRKLWISGIEKAIANNGTEYKIATKTELGEQGKKLYSTKLSTADIDESKEEKYKYEDLVKKDDVASLFVQKTNYSLNELKSMALKNAAKHGHIENGNVYVFVDDMNEDVRLSKGAISHGADRRANVYSIVLPRLGELLKNSVTINELKPRDISFRNTYVNVAAAHDLDSAYIVLFVINSISNDVEEVNVVYSANTKKNPLPHGREFLRLSTDSDISIAEMLDLINTSYPDVLSKSALEHFGRTERPKGKLGKSALYSVKMDSEGRELSQGQQDYFKDSQIRDKEGRLLLVYHGTPSGGFTVFRNGLTYFTANKQYAERYTRTSASGRPIDQKNPQIYSGYVNITKPFVLTDKECKRIFIEEYIKGGYAQGMSPYASQKEIEAYAKNIDWTEADNLKDFFDENEYDYDGIILNEGGDLTENGTVMRGDSYVIFESNQFKSENNVNPTNNPDIRYSIKENADRVFYTRGIEIVKNPTSNEFKQMQEDIYKEYPWLRGTGEPLFRHTYDEEGNVYYWEASKAMHYVVEPAINEHYNTRTSQQWNWWTYEDKDDYPVNYNARFSLKQSVEDSKDLMAIHNVRGPQLLKTLKLGGFAMPSLAIMRAQNVDNNADYGEISVVFTKDTIDPQRKSNKVYSLDAWTPTYPRLEYKLKEKETNALYKKVQEMKKPKEFTVNPVDFHPENINDRIQGRGEEGLVDYYLNDIKMKNLFLAQSGKQVDEMVTETTETTMSDYEVKEAEYILENYADVIDKLGKSPESVVYVREHMDELKNMMADIYRNVYDFSEDEVNNVMANIRGMDIKRALNSARNYKTNGKTTTTTKENYDATYKLIEDRTDEAEYKKWLEGLFEGIVEKSGIYNGKDVFTSSGARRSWEALHMEETLENVVKEMLSHDNGEGLFGGGILWAAGSKKFKSIEEIRESKGQLNKTTEEEYQKIKEEFGQRMSKLAHELAKHRSSSGNNFIDNDDAVQAILGAFIDYNGDAAKVEAALARDYNYKGDLHNIVARTQKLLAEVGSMPTGYFEAKLERAVGLDEVAYVVLPEDADQELIDKLNENNIPYYTYESGNESDRLKVVNENASVEKGTRFSRKMDNKDIKEQSSDLVNSVIKDDMRKWFKDTKPEKRKKDGGYFNLGRTSEPLKLIGLGDKRIQFGKAKIQTILDTHPEMDEDAIIGVVDLINDPMVIMSSATDKKNSLVIYGEQIINGLPVMTSLKVSTDSGEIEDYTVTSIYASRIDKLQNMLNHEVIYYINPQKEKTDAWLTALRVQFPSASIKYGLLRKVPKSMRPSSDLNVAQTKENSKKSLKMDSKGRELTEGYSEISSKKLGFTDERIDELLSGGYYGSSNPNYAQAYITYMSPDEFLRLTTGKDQRYLDRIKDWKNGESDRKDFSIEGLSEEYNYQPIQLHIARELEDGMFFSKKDTYEVVGHEGRHRIWQLQQMGYEQIPVLVFDSDNKYSKVRIDSMSIMPQWFQEADDNLNESDRIEVKDLLPFSQGNREEIKRLYGSKSNADTVFSTKLSPEQKRYIKGLEREVEQLSNKIDVMKAKQLADMEKAEKKAMVNKIIEQSKTLAKWLLTNPKQSSVPQALRKPIADLLTSIDYTTSSRYWRETHDGRGSIKDRDMAVMMGRVRHMLTEINQDMVDDPEAYDLSQFDWLPAFTQEFDRIQNAIAEAEKEQGKDFTLQDMSIEDLTMLNDLITALKTSVTNMNKLFGAHNKESVSDVGNEIIRYLNNIGLKDIDNGLTQFLEISNTTPYYFFKRLGPAGQRTFKFLMDGLGEYAFHAKEIEQFAKETFSGKNVKEWRNEVKEFTISEVIPGDTLETRETTIKMTVPQIMSLYCLARRDQALRHISTGGIKVSTFNENGKKVRQTGNVTLSEKDLNMITSVLTDEQKEVADKLQHFMATTCAKWGNEVTMKRFGYKGYTEKNYFPINVDQNVLTKEARQRGSSIYQLLNMGFTKPLNPKAKNPIEIFDIFETFTIHATDMAQYNALALPVLDVIRVWNYKEVAEVETEGGDWEDTKNNISRDTGEQVTLSRAHYETVKGSIDKALGEKGNSYIGRLLADINGDISGGRADKFGKRLIKNYKTAAVAANIQVALLQPLSYIRAGYAIDEKYLTKAMTMKADPDLIQKYCGIAVWKALGFYNTAINNGLEHMIMQDDSTKDKIIGNTLWFAGKMDELTWRKLWCACELEVRDTTNLEVGSEAYYEKVADRLTDLIYGTQVVDSVLTRSELMRGTDMYTNMVTAFNAEPTLGLNILMDAAETFDQVRRAEGKQAALTKCGRTFRKAAEVYILGSLAESVLRAVWGRIRNYDGDDEESLIEDILRRFLQELNPLRKIPIIKDVYGILADTISVIRGKSSMLYTDTRMDEASIEQIGNAMIKVAKAIQKQKVDYKTINAIAKGLDASGIPVSSTLRIFKGIWNNTIGRIYDSMIIK